MPLAEDTTMPSAASPSCDTGSKSSCEYDSFV
jgi:hypothetical protein